MMPILRFEKSLVIQDFVQFAQKNNLDLSDLLIAHSALFDDCEKILTFDKRASRLSVFEWVK